MTNNETENDIDIDAQEDFEKEPKQRASLKDTWDSNPMLKIAAVILGIALLAGGYFAFFGQEKVDNNSAVQATNKDVKERVGIDAVDPEIAKKIQKQNETEAKAQAEKGGSAIPRPINAQENSALTLPATPPAPAVDPLAEWRQKTEAKRVQMENEQAPEEKEQEQPEVVPLVQPIHPQPTMKMDPNAAKMLQEQMRTIIASQAPPAWANKGVTPQLSLWAQKVAADKKAEKGGGAASGGTPPAGQAGATPGGQAAAQQAAPKKNIVLAGSIAYAQLINDLNTDIPGPVLAQVLSGPFEGGRAFGSFSKDIIGEDGYMTLTFTKIIKDGVTYNVQATALDENSTLTGLQSDINHHYFARFVLPAVADFVKGYSQALGTVGTQTITTAGGGVASSTPPPSPRQAIMQGFQDSAQQVASEVTQDANVPITVLLTHGTTMGLLFTQNVTTGNIAQ
jgi:intracellular multiplication protein IcmE